MSDKTNERKIIKNKVGLLEPARQLGNVSRACQIPGYPRDSFYRFQELYGAGGEQAVREISKRKPIVENRVDPEIEEGVRARAKAVNTYLGGLPPFRGLSMWHG